MDDILEWVEDFLKVLELDEIKQSLGFSISIFIWLVEQKIIWELWVLEDEKEKLFANSLLNTIIQDGGIRERSVLNVVNSESWIIIQIYK